MTPGALSARLHRRALDRDLAAGVAPWRTRAHAVRVTQLTNRRHRWRLAAALDNVLVSAALSPAQQAHGAVVPCRASVRATADQIRELADRLRSNGPVAAAGVIRLEAVLCDGAGPIYVPGQADRPAQVLTVAARWLDGEE